MTVAWLKTANAARWRRGRCTARGRGAAGWGARAAVAPLRRRYVRRYPSTSLFSSGVCVSADHVALLLSFASAQRCCAARRRCLGPLLSPTDACCLACRLVRRPVLDLMLFAAVRHGLAGGTALEMGRVQLLGVACRQSAAAQPGRGCRLDCCRCDILILEPCKLFSNAANNQHSAVVQTPVRSRHTRTKRLRQHVASVRRLSRSESEQPVH